MTRYKQIHPFFISSFLPGLFLTGIFYLSLSCNLIDEEAPLYDNTLNPDDPEFIQPETFIIDGPNEGETITVPTVTFTLSGNEGVKEYSHSLNGGDSWSSWSEENSFTVGGLMEETYVFDFKARYHEEAEDETPETRSFTVDAVKGPALMFSNRSITPGPNQSFSLDLIAEEITDVSAVYAEIRYDKSYVQLNGWTVSSGDILESTGGTIADIIEHDASAGILTVNLVTIGTSSGVNGTGSLISLQFTALSKIGNSSLSLKNTSIMIDSDLNEQTINELVNCRIEVGSTEGEG